MLNKLRIVTLSENTVAANGFHAEWGLSVLAETPEGNVLLDTGNSVSAIQNADRLGVNLAGIDKLVLSHSHGDHTGGLRDFLRRRNKEIEIIGHPEVFALKYGRTKGQPDRFSGIPFRREELESLGARFTLTDKPVKISENIMTTGQVPMVTDFEKVMDSAYRKEGTELVPDDIKDDQSIVMKTDYGLVVLLGCAHRGVINHLLHAQKISGMKEIHTVIGGCHLFNAKKEQVDKTVAALRDFGIKQLGVSHCTGLKPAFAMMQVFGDRFFFNNAGTITKIPAEEAK
jgi:7,8-dihydropterin-6-yl-methyl-4-(beta-D-ribofuranosyl)aminobenzene 5'-phosphate synthase